MMDLIDNKFENEEDDAKFKIPDWQVKFGKQELQHIANGTAGLLSWDEANKQFES